MSRLRCFDPSKVIFDARLTKSNMWELIFQGRHSECNFEFKRLSIPQLWVFKCFSCKQGICGYWDILQPEELKRLFGTSDINYLGERK